MIPNIVSAKYQYAAELYHRGTSDHSTEYSSSTWSSGTTLYQHQSPGGTVVQTLRSVVGPSTFLLHEYGMHCLKTLFLRRHYQHSGVDLKPFSSSDHISI